MLRIDANIIWIIVNLLIFFILIKKFLFKPILNIIDQRKQMIDTQFSEAQANHAQALELKNQYEVSISGAKEEAVRLVEDARKRGKIEYEQIVKQAEEQAGRIMKNANETLERERQTAIEDVRKEIGNLAMAAAVKIIGEAGASGTDRELYNDFLKKAGD